MTPTICRIRGCKNEVCDRALLMCFDHIGKDALMMLVDKLRQEMADLARQVSMKPPEPIIYVEGKSLTEYVENAKKWYPQDWFEWVIENLPLESTLEGNGQDPLWIGDETGGYRWRIYKNGLIEFNLLSQEDMVPQGDIAWIEGEEPVPDHEPGSPQEG